MNVSPLMPPSPPAPSACHARRGVEAGWCARVRCRAKRFVASCLADPRASRAEREAHRARQYHEVARQLLPSVIGVPATVAVLAVLFWDVADRAALLGWGAGLFLVSLGMAAIGWRRRAQGAAAPVGRGQVARLAALLGLSGVIHGLLMGQLAADAGPDERVALVAVAAAGLAAGAWQFAAMAVAGLSWSWGMVLTLATGFAMSGDGALTFLAVPLVVYGVFLTVAILVTARSFIARMHAEFQADEQSQLLALLLHDFEETARDWLWETDREGRLRHVSARAAERFGYTVDALRGRYIVRMAFRNLSERSAEDEEAYRRFEDHLRHAIPFRGVEVPVEVRGERRWWSVSAKPLFDGRGQVDGWRGVGTDVTRERRAVSELARLASVDSLTGLSNRRRFLQRLGEFVGPEACATCGCTLLLLDLDHFKSVNDVLGHPAGDRLLQVVAERLVAAAAPGDLVSRLGGDEFALLLPKGRARAEVEAYAARVRERLEAPLELDGYRIDVRASVGVACAPEDAAAGDELLKAADLALYQAKAAGRDTVAFFEPGLRTALGKKTALLADLREALRQGEFVVYYQPQWGLSAGELVGFEALVRWRHPARGLVPPSDFIPIAEESGLILPLGAWVMEQACRDAARWPSPLKVAVNVSPVQFAGTDVHALVERALAATGLPPSRLDIELTESTLVHENEVVLTTLERLRGLGVGVALDDFGTGYSSLAYLRAFPIDKLKVDRAFVSRLDDHVEGGGSVAIVKAILELARALNLGTVAEGVETHEQRDVLRELGCGQAQGYLFAKPIAHAEVEAMLGLAPLAPGTEAAGPSPLSLAPASAPQRLPFATERSARPSPTTGSASRPPTRRRPRELEPRSLAARVAFIEPAGPISD